MTLDTIKTVEVIEALENFLEAKRPPVHLRDKIDLGYKIEGQSVVIFEIRPNWVGITNPNQQITNPNRPGEKLECNVAKATFVKAKNHWRVYWVRGNLDWESYVVPTVKAIDAFLKLVKEDRHGCFFG